MPALYDQMPVRLQADLVSNPPVVPIDANTGLPIRMWTRQGISIAVGIFDVFGIGVDLSNLAFLQVVIQTSQNSVATSASKTVQAGAIIPVISRADWLDQSNQNALFVFSNAEMDLSLAGGTEAPYWISLVGQTTGGANIVYAAGPITLFNPGPGVPAPDTGVVDWHSTNSAGGNFVVTPGAQIHTEQIVVSGAAETRDITVLAVGLEAGAQVGLRFRLPATDGLIHRIFDQSLAGALLATITCDPDGFTPAAKVNLVFDGANLQRDTLIIPAFGQQN